MALVINQFYFIVFTLLAHLLLLLSQKNNPLYDLMKGTALRRWWQLAFWDCRLFSSTLKCVEGTKKH